LFGIGGTELAIILIFAFIVFGPDKLPEIAQTVGKFIRQFQDVQKQVSQVIQDEVVEPLKDLEPLVNPMSIFDEKSNNSKSTNNVDKSSATPSANTSTSSLSQTASQASATDETADDTETKPSADALKAAIERSNQQLKQGVLPQKPTRTEHDSFAERRAKLAAEESQRKRELETAQTASEPEIGTAVTSLVEPKGQLEISDQDSQSKPGSEL
jgi:sec-independent protein translocase protein TatB/colicin import membrane protein